LLFYLSFLKLIIAPLVHVVGLNYESLSVVQKFMEGPCGKL